MRKIFFSVLFCYSAFFLVSCKKDSGDNSPAANNLPGDYKFVSLTATTVSTQEVTDGATVDKSVTTSTYTTTNNTGTLTISPTTITTTGLSYSIDAVAHSEIYENGVLQDTEDLPFQVDVPLVNSSGDYKWVSNDSVYFSSTNTMFGGNTIPTGPSGARMRKDGDKLYVSATKETVDHQTDPGSGYVITSTAYANAVATYQKQ